MRTTLLRLSSRGSLRVFVLWSETGGFPDLKSADVFDGSNHIVEPLAPIDTTPAGRDGTGGLSDLIVGATRFDLTVPHPVIFGIGISLSIGFEGDTT